MWLCTKKSANTFIAVVYLTINFSPITSIWLLFLPQHYLLALPSTHYCWHISQIIITCTLKGELLLSKCNCILAGSYPVSPPFPFNHNYTCRRVKWGEHGMGPMQQSLTTATPFKTQKILFKARALGSNLIHRTQLFEGRIALNLGLKLTLISFSCAHKHFLG